MKNGKEDASQWLQKEGFSRCEFVCKKLQNIIRFEEDEKSTEFDKLIARSREIRAISSDTNVDGVVQGRWTGFVSVFHKI